MLPKQFVGFVWFIIHVVSVVATNNKDAQAVIGAIQEEYLPSSVKELWQKIPIDPTLTEFVTTQSAISSRKLLANVHPSGTIPGTTVASPSRSNPNYWYHWVRDAALAMHVVVQKYERALLADKKDEADHYEILLWNYAALEKQHQETPTWSGNLGEPKFNVDGTAFNSPWGRPQHDGPSLRALTLIRFANAYLDLRNGSVNVVRDRLYRPELPAQSVIKRDLEHAAQFWDKPSFELWEESFGYHIHVRGVTLAALQEGARFAGRMCDPGAERFYRVIARLCRQVLNEDHWSEDDEHLLTTVPGASGPRKDSNLDVASILTAIQTHHILLDSPTSNIVKLDGEHVLLTAIKLAQHMKRLHHINKYDRDGGNRPLAPGIGRYEEDTYDGYNTNGYGNPWFLTTNAFAELCFRVATKWKRDGVKLNPLLRRAIEFILQGGLLGDVKSSNMGNVLPLDAMEGLGIVSERVYPEILTFIVGNLTVAGDAYLRRVWTHLDRDGSMSEQFHRANGYMQGAEDLTWSHASFVTAAWARDELIHELKD